VLDPHLLTLDRYCFELCSLHWALVVQALPEVWIFLEQVVRQTMAAHPNLLTLSLPQVLIDRLLRPF
jgi:hypothetical protein